jgi:ferredoxin-NADP reductase
LYALHLWLRRRRFLLRYLKGAFLDELMRPHEKNPHYTFIGTMTSMEKSSREWQGELGFIAKAMLLKYINDLTLPIFYIACPQGMVAAMRKALNESGVDDAVFAPEGFSGY